MHVPSLLILVLGGLVGSTAHSANFETPEDAQNVALQADTWVGQ
jgi:hypothetical protein